jgi:lysine 2,3-aminomutase
MSRRGRSLPAHRGKDASPWRDVGAREWNDWRWQLRNLVRTPERLAELLHLPGPEVEAIRLLSSRFRFAVSPYYFSLIDPADPSDPIRRMIVPGSLEDLSEGEDDPLAEQEDRVAPGLTHRYPDRVLFVVTAFCSSYCRFCIRKRNWQHSDAASTASEIDEAVAYIRAHQEIRDVLVSGGDPLTLPLAQLDHILGALRSVPHVELVRIGTREPVMLPMRVDDALLAVLDRHAPLWINTHFNHPREITPEAAEACGRLARLGIPLGNQSVLLKGVNDDPGTMKQLVHGLLQIRVRPYYLYQADPVVGASHLRTSVWKGLEIIRALQGHTSGLAVPTFVVDAPGGGGKIPLMPNPVVGLGPGRLVLHNFEGGLFGYPEDGAPAATLRWPGDKVAEVASGRRESVVPQDHPHYRRRRAARGAVARTPARPE